MTLLPPDASWLLAADQPAPGPSFNAIVDSAARAAAALVADAGSWWNMPSTSLLNPAVVGAHDALRGLMLLVLTASVLVQFARIILLRRGEPLVAVAGGLLRFALSAALGVTVLQAALWAGDALALSLLGGTGEQGGALGETMREALTARRGGLAEPFLLLLLAAVVLLLAAAQWMAMALRQIALLVVAATLPLAAAGSLTATTRTWLSRLVPWALALVLYKPAAALIHAVGQRYLEQLAEPGGASVNTVLGGIVVLGLGVAALPVSLRLLSFTSVRIANGGISPQAMSGALGAVRLTARGPTSSAVRLATFMESAGPGSGTRPTGAAPVGTADPWSPVRAVAPEPSQSAFRGEAAAGRAPSQPSGGPATPSPVAAATNTPAGSGRTPHLPRHSMHSEHSEQTRSPALGGHR